VIEDAVTFLAVFLWSVCVWLILIMAVWWLL